MTLSAAETYLLELINRGRLDPAADAARYGISLNKGLAAGTISASAKQVLAPNAKLEAAAIGHSKWMLAEDEFSHTGKNGTQPADRAEAAGYTSWSTVGENIAWAGTTGSMAINASTINTHYKGLFLSEHHRVNTMLPDYREIGLAEELGKFKDSGTTFNTAMLTELFGKKGSAVFLTGVAYSDSNDNNFYTIGEGRGSVTFTAQGKTATTSSAGLYSLSLATDSTQDISGKVGSKSFSLQLDMGSRNAKLDVVDGTVFFTSADITLKTGIHNARLLGVAGLDATGNSAANTLWGNKGANSLAGNGGADHLYGGAGGDSLYGGAADDFIYGGDGADRLNGGAGDDVLSGGAGKDRYYFSDGFSKDQITGFSVSGGEKLILDDAIWGSTAKTAAQVVADFATDTGANIVLNFGAGDVLTLTGVSSLSGLAGVIEII